MKKMVSVIMALMLVVFATVPAFAVESPTASLEYTVEVIPTEGGDGSYEFTTGIDTEGNQTVHIVPKPNPGFTFDHWVIEGPYTTDGSLTDAELDLIITGDITVTPIYKKDGQVATGTVSTDTSGKSPQTGSNEALPYVVVLLSLAACGSAVFMLVKSEKKKG